MPRKNPENKPLRIVRDKTNHSSTHDDSVSRVVVEIMKCQAMLIKAGKNSALPHFIACIKELEIIHGFHFEQLDSDSE